MKPCAEQFRTARTGLACCLAVALAFTLEGCGLKNTSTRPVERPATGSTAAKPKPVTPPTATAPDTQADPDTQFKAAMAALKAKDLATAKAGFAALAKDHPEFSGPLTNLAILEYKGKARDAAIADFNRAVSANQRNAIAYNWLGILYREAGNYPKAEQSYLKSLEQHADQPAVVLNLAILYDVYLQRPVDALARYRQYQQLAGGQDLKVAAWIRMLEESSAATAPQLGNPHPAPPASPQPARKPS